MSSQDSRASGSMEAECGYNGWANKETWLVHLWLTNDAASDASWRAVAREVGDLYQLAEVLRGDVEEGVTAAYETGLYADLLLSALARVDWDEVARHLVE